MHLQTPPMGWNSWNTFGDDVSAGILMETADAMVEKGFRDAGYRYVIIDDAWLLKQRDAMGRQVPDPAKFPQGIEAVADYVHARGLKLGIYSCAGLRTCGGYPGSYDHEFEDARQYAQWGVDYLKYDFCDFPDVGNNRVRYMTMSMALRATGRDIFFAACNWGQGDPELWMRSVGANSFRSTYDILDNFPSCAQIAQSQLDKLHASAPPCFNDLDMLTVGMYGRGHVGLEDPNNPADRACTDTEYEAQFLLWVFLGSPLILGADLRNIDEKSRRLLTHPALLAIHQDAECRSPYKVWSYHQRFCLVRHMSDRTLAILYANLDDDPREVRCPFADMGLPWHSGLGLRYRDVLTGEDAGVYRDYAHFILPGHTCRLFRASFCREGA